MSAPECRRQWAAVLIGRAPHAAPYGSPAWLLLDDGPEKVAAVVRAAESWAHDCDNLEENLRLEVEAMQLWHKRLDDAAFVERGRAHAAAWNPRTPGFRSDPAIEAAVEQEFAEWVGEDE